jgi:hypothetical protein
VLQFLCRLKRPFFAKNRLQTACLRGCAFCAETVKTRNRGKKYHTKNIAEPGFGSGKNVKKG